MVETSEACQSVVNSLLPHKQCEASSRVTAVFQSNLAVGLDCSMPSKHKPLHGQQKTVHKSGIGKRPKLNTKDELDGDSSDHGEQEHGIDDEARDDDNFPDVSDDDSEEGSEGSGGDDDEGMEDDPERLTEITVEFEARECHLSFRARQPGFQSAAGGDEARLVVGMQNSSFKASRQRHARVARGYDVQQFATRSVAWQEATTLQHASSTSCSSSRHQRRTFTVCALSLRTT
jgi:hypothetical protein